MSPTGVLRRPVVALTLAAVLLIACGDGYTKHYEHGGDCDRALPEKGAADAGIHEPFDRLVKGFVEKGVVHYHCFDEHEAVLDGYLAVLARTKPEALSEKERLAFWINAYNAFTIKLILDHYPEVESIRNISRPWKRKAWIVGGRKVSLDEIEHQILRKKFTEPRIHFAIVCASLSCPDLVAEAYVAPRLEEQLERAARTFIRDAAKGAKATVLDGKARLHLSKLFDWFGEDFEKKAGTVLKYVTPYLAEKDRGIVEAHAKELRVEYLDYDWGLNGP